MRPAVAVTPPNEISFTSSRFEQMRQTQKITPNVKKGSEKERFIILVFYVVFKHTEDICPLLFFLLSGCKDSTNGAKNKFMGAYLAVISLCSPRGLSVGQGACRGGG